MTLRSIRIAGLTSLCLLLPAAASAWWAWNRHEVFPVAEGVWEVVSEAGASPQHYWCAAGDYAFRELGASLSQRIYIWRGIGPSLSRPQRKAVQFAFAPPPGADGAQRLTLNIRQAGNSRRVGSAKNQCSNQPPRHGVFLD